MIDPKRAMLRVREEIAGGSLDTAFAICESLLDQGPDAEGYELLIDLLDRRTLPGREANLSRLLEQVEDGARARQDPWRRYLRFVLLSRSSLHEEAFAASAELVDLPARYGWMRFDRAALLLWRLWAFDEAIREYEAVLATTPRFWKASACRAEVELCRGQEADAFALLDACIARLRREESSLDVANAVVWAAELKLWVGRYADALGDLEEPAAGRHQLALGWRGAAHLLLGDPARALLDLDVAVALHPLDGEALVWRGEALAHLQRWGEAEADFERAVGIQIPPLWGLCGRALARARRGDAAGFWSDYERLPPRVVAFSRAKLGAPRDRDLDAAIAVLETLRADARGLRRPEAWLSPVWMRRGAAAPSRAPDRPMPAGPVVAPATPGETPALFGLTVGGRVPVPGVGSLRVDDVRRHGPTQYEITLSREGGHLLVVLLSTAPTPRYFRRTSRGHYLSYQGRGATTEEVRALEQVARYL